MKVILSRKGFDSSNGGVPSPIMPDGTLLSMPIPTEDNAHYGELYWDGASYEEILSFGNIGGYICLRSVLFFGISGLFLVYAIIPFCIFFVVYCLFGVTYLIVLLSVKQTIKFMSP